MALFRSKYKAFVQNVRPSTRHYHPVTGVEMSMTPALRAEFGILGDERTILNPESGEQVSVADIHGGFFDSLAAQEQHGWTDDERETVEAVLRRVARDTPFMVQEVIPQHVPADRPWQTYDETPHHVIADVAKQTNCVGLALRYERENLNRPAVLAALMAAVDALPEEQGIEELAKSEPREEIPADMLQPADSGAGTLSVGRPKKDPKTNAYGAVLSTPGFTEKVGAGTILLD